MDLPLPEGLAKIDVLHSLSAADRYELFADLAAKERASEPPEVTERLRPYRLLHELQSLGDLDAPVVDKILQSGPVMVPLLTGFLRAWAQSMLPDGLEHIVENSLALIGEIGDPTALPAVLEFGFAEDRNLTGAAAWAFDRILVRNPQSAARVLEPLIPKLCGEERTLIASRLAVNPAADPDSALMTLLTENLSEVESFPMMVTCMSIAGGKAGAERAEQWVRRNRSILPRNVRRECEQRLEIFRGAEPIEPMPLSPWNVYDICAGDAVWGDDEELADDELDETDLNPYSAPPLREARLGRNDPCWCGSGRKYKKCHLDSDQGQAPRATAPASEFDSVQRQIGDFLARVIPKADLERASLEFPEIRSEEGGDRSMALLDWMVHDWIPPSLEHGVMTEFLRRHGFSLSARAREAVASWARSFVCLYEVQDIVPETGLAVKNLLTGETCFTHNTSMSRTPTRWDAVFLRIIEGSRGLECTGCGLMVPRNHLPAVRQWMEDDREPVGLPWDRYLKHHWPRIRSQVFAIIEHWRGSLQLCNTDGDPLLMTKSIFRVYDHAAAIASLRSHKQLSEEEAGVAYTWLNPKQTVLGTIRVTQEDLVLECNSQKRCNRGKKLLAKAAGGALSHVRDELTSQEELKRMVASRASTPENAEQSDGEIPPEVRFRIITQALEQHYSTWPDQRLPALGGKTPRAAAKTADGRRRVEELVRDLENSEERKRRDGEPFYDVARIRSTLGL